MNRSDVSVRREVIRFALVSLVVLALVVAGGILALRDIGRDEAVRQAREVAELAGQGIVEPALTEGLLEGDAAARQDFDDLVQGRVLGDAIVRVRIWRPDGRIVYADDARLEGRTFPLDADVIEAVAAGRSAAEISDLGDPENVLDRGGGEVLEVYLPVRAPDGRLLVFETYQRLSTVTRDETRLLEALLPVILGGLLVLWLVQLPLAVRLARRVRDARRDRESLLQRAVEASDAERRRIAADLHDGPVQDLAGLAFSLEATAGRARAGEADPDLVAAVRDGASSARRAMRSLRGMLVDIHPPALSSEGLRAALSDLAAPLTAAGMEVGLDVPPGMRLPVAVETLLFRVAQESLRNVAAHAGASRVDVSVGVADGAAMMAVVDDGTGFAAGRRERAREEGHMGLRLLEEMVAQAGGTMRVESAPGAGTRVTVEVPVP